jgi:hypothetical protein
VPAAHFAQALLPDGAAVPASHSVQLALPAWEKLPAGHVEQEMLPALENEPASHVVQVMLFSVVENVPGWQGEQTLPLTKVPAWQPGVQSALLALPGGELAPSGHAVQLALPDDSA